VNDDLAARRNRGVRNLGSKNSAAEEKGDGTWHQQSPCDCREGETLDPTVLARHGHPSLIPVIARES
jgi:hypothetical protein